jgi:tetratricopeptide (TPR) repeat protein
MKGRRLAGAGRDSKTPAEILSVRWLVVDNPRFALADLLLVILSGAAWAIIPRFGTWFTLIALVPWVLRSLNGKPAFQRTPFDPLIALFLLTALSGYWAAYDTATAWIKLWLVMTAVLLYYALCAQPKENHRFISLISFLLGIGISIHFFLTYDFGRSGVGAAAWWMDHRPQVSWASIPHGYSSGLLILTGIFSFEWLKILKTKAPTHAARAAQLCAALGMAVIIAALFITISRDIWLIAIGIPGIYILWWASTSRKLSAVTQKRWIFPVLILAGLAAIIVFMYLGPARRADEATAGDYGSNSRAEVLSRGAYFLRDYPITGGGLTSFPGLYSQYMLVIPYYYFRNSYNLFLDIAIEQGLPGGLIFAGLYLSSIALTSQAIIKAKSQHERRLGWLGLVALLATVLHGLFYDYLYNGAGTALLFYPAGMSLMGVIQSGETEKEISQARKKIPGLRRARTPVMMGIMLVAVVAFVALNANKGMSAWYANLGAAEMAQVELRDFPANRWMGTEMVPALGKAQNLLRAAVRYDASNLTANYRLGMIAMQGQDFEEASSYLETAHRLAPEHRGIIKSLGYCYVWLGRLEEAETLLLQIPEANKELHAYITWWSSQDRPDLSDKASMMVSRQEASQTLSFTASRMMHR